MINFIYKLTLFTALITAPHQNTCFASPSEASQFDVSGFAASSLSAWDTAIRLSKSFPKSGEAEKLDPGFPGFSSKVEYTGKTRGISKEKQEFLARFGQEALGDPSFAERYEHEIEVIEGGRPYWLGVQKAVLPFLSKELGRGERFVVYYRFAGAAKKRQPVYLMIEFDSANNKNT